MCGFCGEYVCWGLDGPKSGARVSTLRELEHLNNVEIITSAKAYEVVYEPGTRRATGVKYLDVSDPANPRRREQRARFVIVACGAVQSARLLLMSGPPHGLGNQTDMVGRHAMFHLFGLGSKCVLDPRFQGLVRGELGHTGNVVTYDNYFVEEKESGRWWKAGTMVSTAKKNPLENAVGAVTNEKKTGKDLLTVLEDRQEYVVAALKARRRNGVECMRTRRYLDECLAADTSRRIVVAGDLNDGPGMDYFEENYLAHNLTDILAGSVFDPEGMCQHAQHDVAPSNRYTAVFDDVVPVKVKNRRLLLDHILLSPAFGGSAGLRKVAGSGTIHHTEYDAQITNQGKKREDRPSDHRPVSVVLRY
jgi:choline dehydrogenase-like flavoprotein